MMWCNRHSGILHQTNLLRYNISDSWLHHFLSDVTLISFLHLWMLCSSNCDGTIQSNWSHSGRRKAFWDWKKKDCFIIILSQYNIYEDVRRALVKVTMKGKHVTCEYRDAAHAWYGLLVYELQWLIIQDNSGHFLFHLHWKYNLLWTR